MPPQAPRLPALLCHSATLLLTSAAATFAAPQVVIHEIHYAPEEKTEPVHFVELYNAGDATADLSGWFFSDGFSYAFPESSSLEPGAFLVLAENKEQFDRRFGSVFSTGIPAYAQFDSGSLAASGESLVLRDSSGGVVDEVDYRAGFPWPSAAAGRGPSIELLDPALDNALGAHWRSSVAPTPGKPNSRASTVHPPSIQDVGHTPSAPSSGTNVTVTARVTASEGITSAELLYQIVAPGDYIAIDDARYETEWTPLPMRDDGEEGDSAAGDGEFTTALPGDLMTHRSLVRYRITATASGGGSVRVPYDDDPSPNFAFFVYDGVPSWTGAVQPGVSEAVVYDSALLTSVPVYHLITKKQDHLDAQFLPGTTRGSGYAGSDYLWRGTLVYDGAVYDHISYRARGGVWRYAMGKNMWKFDFHRTQRFRARDEHGLPYPEPWRVLNFSAIVQQGDFRHRGEQGLFESVGFELFEHAGIEAPRTHFVHFRIIENAGESNIFGSQYVTDFQGLYLAVEQIDGAFLDARGLPDGNVYKMEGGTGVNGLGGELKNQGPFPEVSDSSDLTAFKTTYERQRPDAEWWRANLELDRYYAYRSILEGIHHYDIAAGKNYYYYHNPESGRWQVHPWDIDLTWDNGMYGDGNEPFLSRVLAIPEYEQAYQNRLCSLLDLLYNEEQLGLLIDEKMAPVYTPGAPSLIDADRAMWDHNPIMRSPQVNPSKSGQGRYYQIAASKDFQGMIDRLLGYARTRRQWMETTLLPAPGRIPNRPTISFTGDAAFPVDGLTFSSSPFRGGTIFAPQQFAAIQWRIAEATDPGESGYSRKGPHRYEIDATWESPEAVVPEASLSIHIPPSAAAPGRLHRVRVRHKNDTGFWSAWSEPFQFVPGFPDTTPYTNGLAVSEILYHPHGASPEELALGFEDEDFEFLELANTGSVVLDLSPLRFTAGISFDFSQAAITELLPGQVVLVVRDAEAFRMRYGEGLPITGQYRDAGSAVRLSNSGETVELSYGSGPVLLSFDYADEDPWPESADGLGHSLELVSPQTHPDIMSPESWAASAEVGGTPGLLPSSGFLTYETWLARWFDEAERSVPGISGPQADPDGDLHPNFIEFASGSDPRQANALHTVLLPPGSQQSGDWTIEFPILAEPSDVRLSVQHSPDLQGWRELGSEEAVPLPDRDGPDGTSFAVWKLRVLSNGFFRIVARHLP